MLDTSFFLFFSEKPQFFNDCFYLSVNTIFFVFCRSSIFDIRNKLTSLFAISGYPGKASGSSCFEVFTLFPFFPIIFLSICRTNSQEKTLNFGLFGHSPEAKLGGNLSF